MIQVHTTCPDLDTARMLASTALEARLAACANITPGILSLFHWQGRIEEETEVSLTLKTRAAHRASLVSLLQDEHPYDLPVITWHELAAGSDAEAWVSEETGGD
jgi:periplasmic divalent cation tolerance protein